MQKTIPRHIIINLFKTSDKGKNLKSSQRKKKQALHTGARIRMTVDFLSETRQVRRQQSHIFKVLDEQNYQPKIFTGGSKSLSKMKEE